MENIIMHILCSAFFVLPEVFLVDNQMWYVCQALSQSADRGFLLTGV